MSLTPGGREAVADTIGLVKADLVGGRSDKSAMGHLGVVLFDVETDQTLQLREAVERMQVQPLMTQRTPECLDHGIAEADLHLGEHTVHEAVGHELVDLGVDVFNTGVGDDSGRPVEILAGFRQDLTRRGGIEPLRKALRQDPAGEIVDDGMQVGLRAIEKSDGCPVWETLLIEAKPRELEQHNQKPNDGGLPLSTALELFVFVQYRRDVVVPIERNNAAASA